MAKGVLTEALKEAKAIREAALKSASNSLTEHFTESLASTVDAMLNEEYDRDGEEVNESDSLGTSMADGMDSLEEEFDFAEEDEDDEGGELDFDLGGEDEMDEDLEELGESDDNDADDADLEEAGLGLTEEDLNNLVGQILDEVEHGSLSDPEDVTEDQHDSGLLDQDMKERGWEEKDAPAKKDWTVKEVKRLKKQLASAITENKMLKRANKVLKDAVVETQTFNSKVLYSHKLFEGRNLKNETKVKIAKKLDKGNNPSEVKAIYEAIEMAFGLVSESKKPRKRSSSTLSEALGHQNGNGKGLTHVEDQHLVNEDARYSAYRMQKIAGILKS